MNDISQELKEFGIKELLKLFKESSGKIKEKIQEVIKEKIESKKYLLSISEDETRRIYGITRKSLYRGMEECLGSHWSMNLIALGIYIAELNEEEQYEIQERTKGEIHKKYFLKGTRISQMGSTGVIKNVIEYLSLVKLRKGYNFIEMGKLFDEILEKWNEITIFVTKEDSINNIELKCLEMINQKRPLFFVFAYGSAVHPAISAIAKLNNNGDLKGYLFDAKTPNADNPNKKEAYSCSFENVYVGGIEGFA